MRRTLLRMRLPLALFVILIVALCAISISIFWSVFAAHANGDYFRIETDHLDIDFPRNWIVSFGDQENFTGTIHVAGIFPPNIRASMIIRIFDENATRGYREQKGIDDASTANLAELRDVYNWILQRNENATLSFVENGTMRVFNYAASFSTSIIGGYVDRWGNYYNNCTFTFISSVESERAIQIVYLGVEKDYEIVRNTFQDLLDTKIRLKEERE